MKCIIFNFDIFLFQPLTVEIFVEEDIVEEDVENWASKNYKRKYRKEWETDPHLESNLWHSYFLNFNVVHTCLLVL